MAKKQEKKEKEQYVRFTWIPPADVQRDVTSTDVIHSVYAGLFNTLHPRIVDGERIPLRDLTKLIESAPELYLRGKWTPRELIYHLKGWNLIELSESPEPAR